MNDKYSWRPNEFQKGMYSKNNGAGRAQNSAFGPVFSQPTSSLPAPAFSSGNPAFSSLSEAYTNPGNTFSNNAQPFVPPMPSVLPAFSTHAFPAPAFPTPAFPLIGNNNVSTKPSRVETDLKEKRKEKKREKNNKKNQQQQQQHQQHQQHQVSNRRTSQPRKLMEIPTFPRVAFAHRARPLPHDLSILKPLPEPLTTYSKSRNSWDVENQVALSELEQEYLSGKQSLQSVFDLMNSKRNVERVEMEKRGLVDNADVRKSLNEATNFIGSCLQMCPIFERVRRSLENNVYQLEKENGKISYKRAVKAFSRPAAGQPPPLPSDVRPPHILVNSLKYLVNTACPILPQSHPFLWDRTRSIRQDFTYQNYQGAEALWCFEVIARIHCLCLHVMAEAASIEQVDWSQQQELEQLNKCLQSLAEFYQHQNDHVSDNEGEMRAYQLMSHFFDEELAASTARLPPRVSNHPLVNIALELRSAAEVSVTLFFQLVRKPNVPLTMRAIAEVHYNALRLKQMRVLAKGLHPKINMYPLSRFVALLGFNSQDEARQFCQHYDLIISNSIESGEEVDINTWDEKNVKDKRPMSQSFDPGLDMHKIQVLKSEAPVSSSAPIDTAVPIGSGMPINSEVPSVSSLTTSREEERKRLLLKLQKQKEENMLKEKRLKEQQKETELRESQLRQQTEQFDKAKLLKEQELKEQQRQQKLREQQLKEQQEQQKQIQQKQYELQKQQEMQLQKQQVLYEQRRSVRNSFITAIGRDILKTVLDTTISKDMEIFAAALKLRKSLAQRFVVRKISEAAKKSRFSQKHSLELEIFQANKRKRVVSHSKPPLEASESLDKDRIKLSPSLDLSMNTGNEVEKAFNSEQQQMVNSPELIEKLQLASSEGLNWIRISADFSTPQGKWLFELFRLGSPLELQIGTSESFHFSTMESPKCDVVLVGSGGGAGDSEVSLELSAETHTVPELISKIEELVDRYIWWHERTLETSRTFQRHYDSSITAFHDPRDQLSVATPVSVPSVNAATIVAGPRDWLRAMISDAQLDQ